MKITIKRKIDNQNISADQIVNLILKDRKIHDTKDFLNPLHPSKIPLADFFENKKKFNHDFGKTISLLKKIRAEKKMIVVYSDYDADGVTGGAILWQTLHDLGFLVMPYVPDRHREGYGFSTVGIDHVKREFDPALIISVDHGIVAHKEIGYAKSQGIPIIVTDHHERLPRTPDAFAIFHTSQVSGSGVAYFFAKEIFKKFSPKGDQHNLFEKDYLAMAAIGTIADLVPLIGPARSLAYWGLEAIKKCHRPGINQILKEAQIEERKITPYEVGFIIAPRINAFGRLGHAIDALRLLCTNSDKRARELAKKAALTNKDRQEIVEKTLLEAMKKANKDSKIIILYSKNWHEGIIGLVASKIADKFYRPTVVITGADGFAKASARSIPGFDITSFLRSKKKYLIDVGGHKAAAGFTISIEKIDDFTRSCQKDIEKILPDEKLIKEISVDLDIPLSVVNLGLAQKLDRLSPYGIGNPTPVFASHGEIMEAKIIGKNKNHLKIYLKENNSFPLEVMFFGEAEKYSQLTRGQKVMCLYNLSIDWWGGRESIKGRGKHLVQI